MAKVLNGLRLTVKRFFTKYATFTGRASRSEYWWMALVNFLVYLLAAVIAGVGGR